MHFLALLFLAFGATSGQAPTVRPEAEATALEERLERAPSDDRLRRAAALAWIRAKAFHRALALLPVKDRSSWGLRGRALFELGRYEEALGVLDRSDPGAILMIVDALEALGRIEDAHAAIDRAVELLGAEHPAALVLEGRRSARRGDHAAAARAFRAARERDPWNPSALFGLGRALVRAGERDEGLAVLAEHRRLLPLLDELEFRLAGVALDPEHGPNHAAVGDVERRMGRIDRALEAYARAFELARGEDLVPVALRYARALEEDASDPKRSLGVLREALARGPSVQLDVREGDLLASLGRIDEARLAWRRALAKRPGDAAIEERLRAVGE